MTPIRLPAKNLTPEELTARALARITKRQRQIMFLFSDGYLLNDDIAKVLSLKPDTIRNAFNQIYKVLGVEGKPGLAFYICQAPGVLDQLQKEFGESK